MKTEDRKEFLAVLARTAQLYEKKLEPEVMVLYWSSLRRYELSDIRKAISAHLTDPERGRFMPKPADITLHLKGDTKSRALRAWTKAVKGVDKAGIYRSVVYDDQRISQVISDMGGWPRFCRLELHGDGSEWTRKEFCERYIGYLDAPLPPMAPVVLEGIHGRQHRIDGYNVKLLDELGVPNLAPVLIGDPERCEKLLASQGLDKSLDLLKRLKVLEGGKGDAA